MSRPGNHVSLSSRRPLSGAAVLLTALTAGALLMVLDAGAAAGGGRPSQSQAAAAARIAVGDQAPDFELRSLEGASYRLGDLRGEKTAIVIFFRGAW
ncbi:MAG TPA: hypothetical protein VGD06_09165 [Acidobacteriota bacterium]